MMAVSIFTFLFVHVFGAGLTLSSDSYNIAFKKPTKQGPSDYCQGTPEVCYLSHFAVDGHIGGSEWSHTTSNNGSTESWWEVDFGGGFYLATIKIFRRPDWYANPYWWDRLKNFTVYGLVNTKDVRNIYTDGTINPDGTINKVYLNSVITLTVANELKKIKFAGIKIVVPSHLLTLSEVQVFLAPNCSLPTIEDGAVILTGYTQVPAFVPIGESLKIQCNQGFRLTLETENLQCEEKGWNTNAISLCSAGTVAIFMQFVKWCGNVCKFWQTPTCSQTIVESKDSKCLFSTIGNGLVGAGIVLLVLLITSIGYKILRCLRKHKKPKCRESATSFNRRYDPPHNFYGSRAYSNTGTAEHLYATPDEDTNEDLYVNTNT